MKRKEARAEAMNLVFESAFREWEAPADIYRKAVRDRGFEEDDYIKDVFFGVCEHLELIDGKISAYSRGWSTGRISKVALAVMRVAVYEILFREDVPDRVAINEAIELIKTYDDEEQVRKFVNGVLNSVIKEKTEE
ncbi:MAG: transcription antitermination factor NusB [Clostridiales bacterium]|nr:transcription antitermination factor NusB [Clostridiales bacterium]